MAQQAAVNGWKLPLIGALFSILLGVIGYAWTDAVTRLGSVEDERNQARERLIAIELDMRYMKEALTRLERKVDETNQTLRTNRR